MKKKTIRTGIVGSGFSATFHFEALSKVHGVNIDVGGVHSLDVESGKAYAQKRDIRFFDSLDAMLDEVDVVHVCVPPVAHEPVSVAALKRDKWVVCEKPLTGYFGDGSDDYHWDKLDKQVALDAALASVDRIIEAEAASKGRLLYGENWVHIPAIQKEREILEKTGAQILWIHGEEAHSGSHSVDYAYSARCGGGVLIGKGCHPLSAALYLKRVEGRARDGKPIRPATVSARAHALTRMDTFRDEGHIRCNYYDIDDFSMMHVEFTDGTVATLFASDVVVGGIHNWLKITANNHRANCNINPNTAMETYNPVEANFEDIYVTEKIETKQGWACTSPDEDWFTGYPQEMEAFYRTIAYDAPAESDLLLAADSISTIYSAYLSTQRQGAAVEIKTY
ncbi:MAG: Gfo/Idh/MocA family oxidoreductase [Candidatus Nealsonbacteria bacterium]|nr:Gfo/Idh/MocA family oxidoreductase [Candidatus Nealsonbacteria bacterium]